MNTMLGERRFGDARAMVGDIQVLLAIANVRWTETVEVKVFPSEDFAPPSVLRLWDEGTNPQGNRKLVLHIL